MTDTTKILPKLRFPEFANDGEWEKVKLGEIAHFLKGKGIPKTEVSDTGVTPCIRYGELYTHYKEVIRDIKSYTNISKDDLIVSKANDVIIPSSGETKEDISTASCITEDGIALGGDINIIRSSANGIYLSYYLNNVKKNDIAKIAQGISIIHLYNEQLQNLSVTIPFLPEQQKIASFLVSLDELISAHKKRLEALKAHKKSLMQQLFPADGEKTPKLRFPEFKNAGEWDVVELGKISDVYSGGTPNVGIPDYYNGSIPFIRSGEIKESHTKLFISQNGLVNSSAKMVAKGDILYALYGATSGEVAISQIDGAINQAILAIIPHNSIDKYLICQILAHKKPDITNRYLQGGQGNLSAQIIKSVTVSIPKYKEQQKIASFLSSIDEIIQAQDNKIQKLKTYKNGLMQQLFA